MAQRAIKKIQSYRLRQLYSSESSDPTPPPELLHHLAQSIESEIMDGFWSSRCLNDHMDLPDMIGSFVSGATASLVAKNRTKNIWVRNVVQWDCFKVF